MTPGHGASGGVRGPGNGPRLPVLCAAGVAVLALVPFFGWLFDLELLKRPLGAGITMNPSTALGFLLGAAALLLLRSEAAGRHAGRGASAAAAGAALASAAIGVLRLADVAGLTESGIDLLFAARGDLEGYRARMAVTTAFVFMLTGSGLASLALGRERGRALAQVLLVGAGICALAVLVGYGYGASAVHGPMALNTAVAFLLLVVGALALEPERGVWASLRGRGPARLLVRVLLPALVASQVLLGALRLTGERRGWFAPESGTAVFVVISCLLFAAVVLGVARVLDRADRARSRAEAALQRQAAELEQANAELDAFSYSVSHDLRAPLRAIDGFSLAVVEDYSGHLDATGRDYLDRVRAAAQKMAQLIDDLLELSRVSRSELRREPTDLSALARELLAELSEREPGRAVTTSVQAGLAAECDPRLVGILLRNLFDNAWKYTRQRASATIEFGAEPLDGEPTFHVRDNGVGFDMAYAGKLFAPFQRLHDAREFEGTGIGLATVKRIVHRHGGRVHAEAAPGRGTTLSFTLGSAGGAAP